MTAKLKPLKIEGGRGSSGNHLRSIGEKNTKPHTHASQPG